MTALLLQGRPVSSRIRAELAPEIDRYRRENGLAPTLAVIRVGNPPAAIRYTRAIDRVFTDCGMGFQMHVLPEDVNEAQVIAKLQELERAADVHGILLQRPLPRPLNVRLVMAEFPSDKDVEGVSPASIGALAVETAGPFRCSTPSAAVELLSYYGIPLAGKRAVVIGRSSILGMPMALMLLQADATVVIAHSQTHDIAQLVRQADVIVAAAGQPALVTAEMVAVGATVIDFGVTVRDDHLVGDVDFEAVCQRAGAITPVPGGTGPVTSAILMRHTVRAAQKQASPAGKGRRKWLPLLKSPRRSNQV